MKTQRKRYSGEFKARIALVALREQQTINEIASEYAIHPSLVSLWKKQALEEMPALFNDRRENNHQEDEALRDQLYQQIGQLKVEMDFL
ncbi:MAG: transposase, partial [Armatimonadota bacterium]|nr:transposase [Armatimonadota bacterium]